MSTVQEATPEEWERIVADHPEIIDPHYEAS
jgi:hypothetical protein